MGRCDYLRKMLLSGIQGGRSGFIPVMECSDRIFLTLFEFLYTGRLGGRCCVGVDWFDLYRMGDVFGLAGMLERLLDCVRLEEVEEVALVGLEHGNRELLDSAIWCFRGK